MKLEHLREKAYGHYLDLSLSSVERLAWRDISDLYATLIEWELLRRRKK